jgi:hypothetical protein
MMANPSMSQADIFKDYLDIVDEEISDGPVKEEAKTVRMTLNKKGDVWQLADNSESDILDTIGGDK